MSDTVGGVRFLPGAFDGGDAEFDIVLESGTPFVSSSWFVFGELYDDLSMDNPEDPIIEVILETSYIKTELDGQVVVEGVAAELTSRSFGPTYFDEAILYADPLPRGPGLNAIAALFVFGVGAVYHPLPVGEHVLTTRIESDFFGDFSITYNILVVPPGSND